MPTCFVADDGLDALPMSTDFDPHRRDLDNPEMVRPTENSSWLVVIVLTIGVALAAWYIWMAGEGTTGRMEAVSGKALSETGQQSAPAKSTP